LLSNCRCILLIDFFDDPKRAKFLSNKTTKKTFIQKIPFAKKFYRFLFPFFPKAIEGLDLSEYDLIISSSYCVAKGIIKHKNQLHICYCHSPVRYAWDLKEEYVDAVKEPISKTVFSYLLDKLRDWDKRTSNRVDYFIANSINVSNRIKQNYNRDSIVIYPPVDINKFKIETIKKNYYITVSRLVSYKKNRATYKSIRTVS
jgi:glycosyltransferase involved in cell wall biosynthesis